MIFSFLAASPTFATFYNQPWTHYGVRPLGMGNAFVAVADDFNALFYNPAGLARLPSWDGEFLNPMFSLSKNTRALFGEMSEFQGSDTAKTLELIDAETGKTHHAAFGMTPHLIFPGFGVGLGLMAGVTAAFHGDVSVDMDVSATTILPIAYARSFAQDRISWGVAPKIVSYTGINENLGISELESLKKNNEVTKDNAPKIEDYLASGVGLGFDAGLLFTPSKHNEPTLGVSYTDIGGTPFKKFREKGKTPKPRLPSVNFGLSYKPIQTSFHYLLTAVDIHGANMPDHFSRKINYGVEWGLGQVIKIQGGLHQGEWSAGFQVDAWLLVIRFATYAEQLGIYAGQDELLSDRRFVMQLKLII